MKLAKEISHTVQLEESIPMVKEPSTKGSSLLIYTISSSNGSNFLHFSTLLHYPTINTSIYKQKSNLGPSQIIKRYNQDWVHPVTNIANCMSPLLRTTYTAYCCFKINKLMCKPLHDI